MPNYILLSKRLKRHWQLYLLIFAPIVYLLIFKYVPMLGAQIAFKDLNPIKGIWGSPWVGFKHFTDFFNNPYFWDIIKNTFVISFFSLIIGFPIPIILALALNEIRPGFFKKLVQMVTYAPYFISTVVMVSIVILFLSPRIGVVDHIRTRLGLESINFMGDPQLFSTIYVLSDIWQFAGYGAVIYMAALSGVNPQLYEAARVDGASRFQKIIHIDIPGIIPAIVLLLILNAGQIMNIGFEKVYLMQNPLNLSDSEIISTYVYKLGLLQANYSFSSAVGLFNSVINLVLLLSANWIARRISGNSLI